MDGCRYESNCSLVGPGTIGGLPSVCVCGGVFSKVSQPVFTRVSEKTMENSERLGRQARLGIEPGTSRLPVFERRTTQPLEGPRTDSLTSMPLVQQLVFPAIAPLGRPYMDRYKICIAVRRAGHKICMCIIGVLLCVSISQLS